MEDTVVKIIIRVADRNRDWVYGSTHKKIDEQLRKEMRHLYDIWKDLPAQFRHWDPWLITGDHEEPLVPWMVGDGMIDAIDYMEELL